MTLTELICLIADESAQKLDELEQNRQALDEYRAATKKESQKAEGGADLPFVTSPPESEPADATLIHCQALSPVSTP